MKEIYCDYQGYITVENDFECEYCNECEFCTENSYDDEGEQSFTFLFSA